MTGLRDFHTRPISCHHKYLQINTSFGGTNELFECQKMRPVQLALCTDKAVSGIVRGMPTTEDRPRQAGSLPRNGKEGLGMSRTEANQVSRDHRR